MITGGQQPNNVAAGINKVRVYDASGAVTVFPSLKQARFQHACGYYYDSQKQVVSIISTLYNTQKIKMFLHHSILGSFGNWWSWQDKWQEQSQSGHH